MRSRVEIAQRHGRGLGRSGGVLGLVDGDGRPLLALCSEFDGTFRGPLFSWKAYCIENLLARAAWPSAWGVAPDWRDVLERYLPYTALNRVHLELRSALETLGIDRFRHPVHGQPLQTALGVKAALAQDKALLAERDVEEMFDREVDAVRAAIATSLDEGHALVNGKWLLRHYARDVTGGSEDRCHSEWCQAVEQAGGLPEVRAWWQRITGSPP